MILFLHMANMLIFPGSQATDQFCKNQSEQEDQNAVDGDAIFKILHSGVEDFLLFVELARFNFTLINFQNSFHFLCLFSFKSRI